jgi:hypothetical protein
VDDAGVSRLRQSACSKVQAPSSEQDLLQSRSDAKEKEMNAKAYMHLAVPWCDGRKPFINVVASKSLE